MLSGMKSKKQAANGYDRMIGKYTLSTTSTFVAEFGEKINLVFEIVSESFGCVFAATYQLDLAKTHLQIQGEKKACYQVGVD